jgi:tetratricopeptide (TPR) repeat protein
MKRNEQKGITEIEADEASKNHPKIFISNKTNDLEKQEKNSITSNKLPFKSVTGTNQSTPKNGLKDHENTIQKPQASEAGKEMIKLNLMHYFKDQAEEKASILHDFLRNKFVPKDTLSNAKKNFFNQLIQIRPPEGINASAASPLIDSNKGWAPSIPSIQVNKMKTKGGIQAGDIPKEAHMAFYLGIMNEEEKKYEEALKFYKKFFLSAKLLQDVYGTELALNRIAVLYSNILEYNQGLYYNEKHKDITTHNVNGFVAFYNCGVCQRILGKIDDSLKSFSRALHMAEEENVFITCNHILGFGVLYSLPLSTCDFIPFHRFYE